MMKKIIFSFIVGFPIFAFAQVGINTNTPEATLDIRAKNHLGLVTSTDGILIPRVNSLAAAGSIEGQLVYLIQNASPFIKGFHYWDATASLWKPFTGGGSAGDPTIDAWVDDMGNNRIMLGTLSDGVSIRSVGTEFIANDNGSVGIGTETVHGSAMLDVTSSTKGILIPRVSLTSSTLQIGTVNNATGLLVFNPGTSALMQGFYYWDGTQWRSIDNSTSETPNIGGFSCATATLTPSSYTAGTPFIGNMKISYTGGNGAKYSAGSPVKINELTFTLRPGKLEFGNGELVFSVTGTPSVSSPTGTTIPINNTLVPFLPISMNCSATIGDNESASISENAIVGPLTLAELNVDGGIYGMFNMYHKVVTSPDGKFSVRVKIEGGQGLSGGYSVSLADLQIRSNITPNVTIMYNGAADWVSGITVDGTNAMKLTNVGTWYGDNGSTAGPAGSNTYTGFGSGWGNQDVYYNNIPEFRRYTWTSTDSTDKTTYVFTFMLGAPTNTLTPNASTCPGGKCNTTKAYLRIEQIKAN